MLLSKKDTKLSAARPLYEHVFSLPRMNSWPLLLSVIYRRIVVIFCTISCFIQFANACENTTTKFNTRALLKNPNDTNSPIAQNDFYTLAEDSILQGQNVVANDSDPNPLDTLFLQNQPLVTPLHGNLQLMNNGTFIYSPHLNYFGLDSFSYQVCDTGNLCDTAVVYLIIQAVNDAPVANNDTISMAQGIAYSGNLISNDSDVDSPNMLANTQAVMGPFNGTLFLANSGVYTYTPNPGFSGNDFFEYVICDFGIPNLCDTARVVITIGANNPPIATNDFFQCNEDDSLVNVSVLTNDFDPDGTALQVSSMLVSPPLNGVLTINTNGTFSYFPTTNYFGPDSFSYKVCDGGVPNYCDTAVVVLTISPVNDAPSAVNDYFNLSANSALQGNVLINDSDLESDSLIVSGIIQSGSLNGNLMLQPNGALSYTPDPNFAGFTALSYIVCNYGFPDLCDTASVLIEVTNTAPVALADTFYIQSGIAFSGNCISNDFDPEGSMLFLNSTPQQNPTHGNLSLTANGNFNYQPYTSFTGTDFFVYEVCDAALSPLCSSAKVLLIVGNQKPVASNDTFYVAAGNTCSGNVLRNDFDPEGGMIWATQQLLPNLTLQLDGSFSYIAKDDFNGFTEYSYEICDNGTPTACDTAKLVFIAKENSVIIPNAFSPNNDNVNDFFVIEGIENFPNNELQIFDRNGFLVFNVRAYKNNWNGVNNKGVALNSGSYFYVFNKKDGSKLLNGYIVLSK